MVLFGAAVGTAGIAWATGALAAAQLPQREGVSPEETAASGARFVRVNGKNVAYRAMGDGEQAIILLHGFSCEMRTWRRLQPLLAQEFRTVAIDLWGFGASARPAHLAPEDWLEEITGVMDYLGISAATIAGHSMGGRAALMLAAQVPERVRNLILLDSDGLQFPAPHSFLRLIAGTPTLRLTLRRFRKNPREMINFLRMCYGDNYPMSESLLLRYQRPLCVKGTEACWTSLGYTYPGTPIGEILRHVTCPSLLFWGADDRITPAKYALKLVESLPDSQLIVIPHAGHLPHETHPDLVFPHITRFLSEGEEIRFASFEKTA